MQPRLVDRVRTRLLAALVVLLVAAIVLAALGWYGMRSAQRALTGFQGEVLPNVTQALELAERTAKLAANAPNVVESRTGAVLEINAAAMASLLGEIERRVDELGADSALGPVLRRLLTDVKRDLAQLVELTKQRQHTQAALQHQLAELDRIGNAMPAAASVALHQPAMAALWTGLVMGAGADSAATLGRLEADVEALWIAAHRQGQGQGRGRAAPAGEQALRAVAFGANSILSLRRQQLELERRTAYLVVLTRDNADQLSAEVAQYVTSLREQAAAQRAQVQQAIRSGETAMLALALGCMLIAALATRYIRRFVGQIETITQVMSRLVAGDTAQTTPGTRRRDELGALARSFEVFRDALLAKQTLVSDLRTQSALLEAVHDNMTDALAVFDRHDALLIWNQRLADLFGRHGAELRAGLSPRQLMESLPRDTLWTTPGQAQAQPLRAPGPDLPQWDLTRFDHIELHLPDGGIYDLRSRTMPDGGTVTLATDLTARRAIERQVQHTQRLEMLGQLTGGVAHDFNNYLGTIIGNLGLLEAEPALQAGSRTQLQRAKRAAGSAAALTRRLLAFARRQPLEAESVDVDAMVEEMRDLIEYSAGAQTRVELSLQARAACVLVDRGHLENALLNLVLNSAAAMPDGGGLTVSTRRVAEAGAEPSVEITVADTGSGIAEHLLGKVFEPFFTTKAPGEGSGLGLSIVYGFVRQSGGDIAVSSRQGEGTTLTLRFPVAAVEPGRPAVASDTVAAQRGALAGLKLLVVDDDEAFRITVADMLQAAGAQVLTAADGREALQTAAATPGLDLVLTDVCLGGDMDGVQVASALHRRDPRLKLCLMSGLSFEQVLHRVDPSMALGLLSKPFDLAALSSQLLALREPAPAEPAAHISMMSPH